MSPVFSVVLWVGIPRASQSTQARVDESRIISETLSVGFMKNRIIQTNILRWYAFLLLISSIAALILSLWTPSEASRSLIFGLSWIRLAIAGLFLGSIAVSIWLSLNLRREIFCTKALQWIDRLLTRQDLSLAVSIILLALFISGVLLIYLLYLTMDSPYSNFYNRLIPVALWLVFISVLSGIAWLFLKPGLPRLNIKMVGLMVLVAIIGIAVYIALWNQQTAIMEDIFFMHREGQRILNGINPYARVLHGDMLNNAKYATLFPLFYVLSASVQMLGLHDFNLWLEFWNVVFLMAYVGIAEIIFFLPYRRGFTILGLFGAFLFIFNRWSLDLIFNTDLDFIPIFLLVCSLALLPRRRALAFILYGLSLAIKQIAIFMLPIYLIWAWEASGKRLTRQFFRDVIMIGLIPILSSLPFLLWNWEGFIRSILFSATRQPDAFENLLLLDGLMDWSGILARLPLLFLLFMVYLLAWQKTLKKFTLSMLIMAVFAGLNSVHFPSYLAWVMPFIALAADEVAGLIKEQRIKEVKI